MLKKQISMRGFSVLVLTSILFSAIGCGEKATPTPVVETPASIPTLTPTLVTPEPPPAQAYLDPEIEAGRFPPNGYIVIRFAEEMESDSSRNPLVSFPYVDGDLRWNRARTALTFRSHDPMVEGQAYTFFLDPALTTAAGASLEKNFQWRILVDPGPQVVHCSPEPGRLSIRQPVVRVSFDRPMSQSRTSRAISIEPFVRFNADWTDGQTLEIEFTKPLEPGNRYELVFAPGEGRSGAADADGIGLAEDYVWSYWLDPLEASVTTPDDRSVEINFNYDMRNQDENLPFRIQPSLDGSWKWTSRTTAIFTSVQPIPLGRRYTLTLSDDLMDDYGPMGLEQGSFTFSAPPPIDVVFSEEDQPFLSSEVPQTISPIRINFHMPVDHASAENAFGISPQTPGRLAWKPGSAGETLEFYPDRLLKASTVYTITMGASVRSRQGDRILLEPYRLEFRTANVYLYYAPSFGIGADVQLVDADGWRFVQFGAQGVSPIRFELYGYSLNDFARLYANVHGDRNDWGSSNLLPIPGEDEEPVASWGYVPQSAQGEGEQRVDETNIPADVPPGLYVLNLIAQGQLYDQLLLVLSGNTLMVKRTEDELFVWLTDIHGESIPDAEIRLYSSRGEIFQEGHTGADGLYETPLAEGYEPMFVSARLYGEDYEDVTIAGLNSQWMTVIPYNQHVQTSRSPAQYLAYIYTERPIYRPGQTVNFKAILRRDRDVSYSLLPPGTQVTVNIRDSRSNLLQSFKMPTNSFGSVNGSFQIVEDAVLGNYEVEVVVEGESHSEIFKVEDYRKPDFEVTVQPADPAQSNEIVVGDELQLQVDASYFFGEPLVDARVSVNVYSLTPYYYYWWEDSPELSDYFWQPAYSVRVGEKYTTDADGKVMIDLSAPELNQYESFQAWRSSAVYATYAVEALVDDGSSQSVVGTYIFTVHSASATIALDNGGYFQRPGEAFTVVASAEDLAGQPLAGLPLDLRVTHWDIDKREFSATAQEYPLQMDALGRARQQLVLSKGYYRLELTGEDDRGNPMAHTTWVYVFSSPDEWFNRTQEEISITAEYDSYRPFDTARLMIESTFSGPAVLTFERGRVIYSKPIQLTAPLTVVETQVIPEFSPNVFVTVNAWQPSVRPTYENCDWCYWGSNIPESHLRLARTELQVEVLGKGLQVEITTDQESYGPGEQAQVTIAVSDGQGHPARAEVSLALVDEAIYSLSGELTPPIFSAFYGPRGLSVSTYDSMSPDRVIIIEGRGGGGGGPGGMEGLRSEFLDTAAWFPAIQTDSSGRATVAVTLPDNLTSWRLTSRAVTLDSRVGEGTASIVTRKDLIIQPLLPRTLTTGDQVVLAAMVHNYGAFGTIEVSLEAPGLQIQGEASHSITLGQDEVQRVTWTALVQAASDVSVSMRAANQDGQSDGVSLPLPVQPAAIPIVETTSGEFDNDLTLVFPTMQIVPEASRVTLQLSRSQSSTLLSGLDYLTGYPYGCIEQTMSRALPNAVVSRAAGRLGLDPGLQDRTDPLVRASIQRLYGMQHSDGGWGWWYDDQSDFYQTAWVNFGLALISQAGYEIDPAVLDRADEYLQNYVNVPAESIESNLLNPGFASFGISPPRQTVPLQERLRTQAFAMYGMALHGNANPALAQALMDQHLNDLDPFSQAALALTFAELNDTARARAVLDNLAQYAVRGDGMVYWRQATQDGEYRQKTMSSTLRTTALVLDAFVRIDPDSELIPGMVEFLIRSRHGLYGWGTTNETTFTILALTDYLVSQEQSTMAIPFEITLGGQLLQAGSLDAGHNALTLDLPLDRLTFGLNTLKVSAEGDARIYYDFNMQYGLPQQSVDPAGALTVSRRYLDPETGDPVQEIAVGQLVQIELVLKNPDPIYFVALEDRLPGGLEALNERLNTSPHAFAASDEWSYYDTFFWQDYGYNYKNIYADRVDFFITQLGKGTHTYTYLARATFAGEFLALPAEAFTMYDLDTWGRSASDVIVVRQP